MEVSHLAELDSHAVLGGGKAQAFFISDSPEFFSILSDNIYRDKKLAVVREVLCNADDAHKMGDGCMKPIEIKLTDNELSITDFGPGIHKDKMHPTYCGYGVSGKRDDTTATGGFGIGCKAPFSYSDHFTVVSCHEGVRTIYAISRGGVDSEGKPGLIPMVTVPTTDTGITVTVPLKVASDRHDFERLIRKVVRQGGMNATLNGVKLDAYDMTGIEKTGYGVATSSDLHEAHIYVRYGAVMYPLTTENPELIKLAGVFSNTNNLKLILAAPPGSLGVTPSREALSYSDKTIETLTNLLVKATAEIKRAIPATTKLLCKEYIETLKVPLIPRRLKLLSKERPYFTADKLAVIKTYIGQAIENMHETRYSLSEFSPEDLYVIKQLMLAASRKFRDHRAFFRRMSNYTVRTQKFGAYGEIGPDNRKIVLRFAMKLGIVGNLLRYGRPKPIRDKSGNFRHRNEGVVSFSDIHGPLSDTPILVLCRGKMQASGYCDGQWTKKRQYVFINVLLMKPAQIEAIKSEVAKYKLTLEILALDKPAPLVRKPKVAKAEKTKVLFHSLASIYGGTLLHSATASLEKAPVFIDMHAVNEGKEDFGSSVNTILKQKKHLLELYPVVALAFGPSQKKALLDLGAREIQDVFAEDVLKVQDTKENRFIINAAREQMVGYCPSNDMVNFLSKKDLRWAKLFIGEKKLNITEKERKVFNIFRTWLNFLDYENETRRKAYSHLRELTRLAEKDRFKEATFAYLTPLFQLWGWHQDNVDIPITDELIDLVRYIQKRATKKATPKPIPAVPQAQLLKEAA